MSEKKPDTFSDIVDRAAAELRWLPVPPGPPPELLEALLQAAGDLTQGAERTVKASEERSSDGAYNQPLSLLQKIRNKIMKQPIKTFTSVAACCLVLIAAYLIVSPMMRGNAAFAEVCAIIQKAKNMVCTGETNLPMPGTTENMKFKIMSLENGRMRQEMGSQMVMIFDWQAGKTLTLSPAAKSAVLLNIKGQPAGGLQQDWLASFKKLTQDSKAEELGPKTINGKEAKGYRVQDGKYSATFWADAKSGDPITIEIQQQIPDYLDKDGKGERTMRMVMSNFQFDVPLEESLFSLTPPEGYKLQPEMKMDFSNAGEKDVIDFLRRYADVEKGAFPDSLTDQSAVLKITLEPMRQIEKKNGAAAKTEAMKAEMMQAVQEAGSVCGRMSVFLTAHPGWKYAGKGVKQGDAQTPVFWYIPQDSKQGRIIYGDLNARDVPVEQLPSDPQKKKSDI